MEAAVANFVADGRRGVVIVTGYFGDRLAQIFERYGASVRRIDVEWGRAVDPQRLRDELRRAAPMWSGWCTPKRQPACGIRSRSWRRSSASIAVSIVDTVTSLGGHDVDLAGWGVDVSYSCAQKCVGAPSGIAPLAVSGPARQRLVKCRSFYLDLKLLEDYWVGGKYHHTMCSSLVYALREALLMIDEEGLEARWARHERHHHAFAAGLEAMGLSLLPPANASGCGR